MSENAEQPKVEYRKFDMSEVSTGGDSKYDDYVTLPSEEPIEAHLVELALRDKEYMGETKKRVYAWFEVASGEGKGQRYRGDWNANLTKGGAKQSDLSKIMERLRDGDGTSPIVEEEVLGLPCRIELSEPWGDKGLQFVKEVKKPLKSQTRRDMSETSASDDDFDAQFDAALEAAEAE